MVLDHFGKKLELEITKNNEGERKRRSLLVYGTSNMGEKKQELIMKRRTQVDKAKARNTGRSFKEKLFLHPEEGFLSVWDVTMLAIIGYSCFTSAYYLGYKMTTNYYLLRVEDVTYCFFALDICFNFVRIGKDKDGAEIRSHS